MAKSDLRHAIVADQEKTLAEHAEAIRMLGKQAAANIVEIGRRLIKAKALAEVKKVVHEAKSKSSPRPPGSGTKKRGGEEAKRHDDRMKSARYKLEAFIRNYSDMAEWEEVIEAIKTQLGAKHV